jgi:hypothetical protein
MYCVSAIGIFLGISDTINKGVNTSLLNGKDELVMRLSTILEFDDLIGVIFTDEI